MMEMNSQEFKEDVDDMWEGKNVENDSGKGSVSELDREWQARHMQFHTAGYREGLQAGKEVSVQSGFNNGFTNSVTHGYKWGIVRGITSAFASLPEQVKEKLLDSTEDRVRLQSLHEKVSSISAKDALKYFHEDVLNGRVKLQTFDVTENVQENYEGNLEKSESKKHFVSVPKLNVKSEIKELQVQLMSTLENTKLKPTLDDY